MIHIGARTARFEFLVRGVSLNRDVKIPGQGTHVRQPSRTAPGELLGHALVVGVGAIGRHPGEYRVTGYERGRARHHKTAAAQGVAQFQQRVVVIAVAVDRHGQGRAMATLEAAQQRQAMRGNAPGIHRHARHQQAVGRQHKVLCRRAAQQIVRNDGLAVRRGLLQCAAYPFHDAARTAGGAEIDQFHRVEAHEVLLARSLFTLIAHNDPSTDHVKTGGRRRYLLPEAVGDP